MGAMRVMGEEGDTSIKWRKDDPADVQGARDVFDSLVAKGYMAYAADPDQPGRGELIREFDPDVEQIILAPRMAGG